MACSTGVMHYSWPAVLVACNSGGMQYWWHAVQVACSTGGMQNWWHAVLVACSASGMQDATPPLGPRNQAAVFSAFEETESSL